MAKPADFKIIDCPFGDNSVMRLHAKPFPDERGQLTVVYDTNALGRFTIQQVNHVITKAGALRGLHYQVNFPQKKLVQVLSGSIFDVCVDLRESSRTFGRWAGFYISSPHDLLLVDHGFAHGFYALTDAVVTYFMDNVYSPENERILFYDDPALAIQWPFIFGLPVMVSDKDAAALTLDKVDKFQ